MRKFATHSKLLLGLMLLLIVSTNLFAQDKNVSGTIIADDDASPLIGVTVTNKSTSKKTQTNPAGYFSIAAEKGQTLMFTYVGYSTKEVEVGDTKTISIRMTSEDKEVGNVVVTAYGIKKNKRDLTYQTITVSGEDIASTKRDNFINSLAGRIPGAMITSTSGMPGASSSIILRGPTSIDGTNQPIFVVDGLIIDNNAVEAQDRLPGSQGNRNNDFGNRAMDINPEDIESVTVLKGPEATSLYGSDGSNGAIVITTRKGTKGKSTISYNNSFRTETVYRLPKQQTVFDQGSLGVTNPLVRTFFGQKIPTTGTQIFDNIGNFFQTGKTQIHNVSIDGGSDMSTYRFTASVYDNQGVVPTTGFTRYNFRLNSTFKLSPKLNVTTSFSYISAQTKKGFKGSTGFLLSLLTWPVDDDIRVYLNPNGTRRTIRNDGGAEDDNPLFDVNYNKNFDINDRLLGNFQLSYDPTKWLNLTAIMGVDYYAGKGTMFISPQSNTNLGAGTGVGTGGNITEYRQIQRLLNGVYRATIKKKFGQLNNTLTTQFNFDSRKEEVNGVRGERLFDPTFVSLNNTDPLTVSTTTTNTNFNKLGLYSGYTGSYKNFLNFTLSGRMDGSSRLIDPLNYQTSDAFYFYWSTGANLILSDLFSLPKPISFAKLRVSYATNGRDPSTSYVKGNKFIQSNTNGGGFTPSVFQGNPDLRPEFGKNLEIGTEVKFFKGRLSVDFAYYSQKVTDQIIAPRLSYASGSILQWINGGDVENKGFEFQILGTPIKNKNLTWNTTINFARNRNKILRMPAGLPQFYNSDTWLSNIRNISQEGGSIYQLAGNRFSRNVNGDLIISPTSGLPVFIGGSGIATGAYSIIGDRQPDFTMGFSNSFIYKSWSLSFLLDIRKGGDIWNGTEYLLYTRGMSTRTLDRETPRVIKGVLNDGLQNSANPTPNTIVISPLFRSDYYSSGSIDEDFIERDINWIRMRDITLSYKVPAKTIKRQKFLKSASIFCTVTDAFMITNYTGADPSVNGNNASTRGGIGGIGMDLGNLATPLGLNFGINVQF